MTSLTFHSRTEGQDFLTGFIAEENEKLSINTLRAATDTFYRRRSVIMMIS